MVGSGYKFIKQTAKFAVRDVLKGYITKTFAKTQTNQFVGQVSDDKTKVTLPNGQTKNSITSGFVSDVDSTVKLNSDTYYTSHERQNVINVDVVENGYILIYNTSTHKYFIQSTNKDQMHEIPISLIGLPDLSSATVSPFGLKDRTGSAFLLTTEQHFFTKGSFSQDGKHIVICKINLGSTTYKEYVGSNKIILTYLLIRNFKLTLDDSDNPVVTGNISTDTYELLATDVSIPDDLSQASLPALPVSGCFVGLPWQYNTVFNKWAQNRTYLRLNTSQSAINLTTLSDGSLDLDFISNYTAIKTRDTFFVQTGTGCTFASPVITTYSCFDPSTQTETAHTAILTGEMSLLLVGNLCEKATGVFEPETNRYLGMIQTANAVPPADIQCNAPIGCSRCIEDTSVTYCADPFLDTGHIGTLHNFPGSIGFNIQNSSLSGRLSATDILSSPSIQNTSADLSTFPRVAYRFTSPIDGFSATNNKSVFKSRTGITAALGDVNFDWQKHSTDYILASGIQDVDIFPFNSEPAITITNLGIFSSADYTLWDEIILVRAIDSDKFVGFFNDSSIISPTASFFVKKYIFDSNTSTMIGSSEFFGELDNTNITIYDCVIK